MLSPFGRMLKMLYLEKEWKAVAFARAMGVSSNMLTYLEHGQRAITNEVLNKIKETLGLDKEQAVKIEQKARLSNRYYRLMNSLYSIDPDVIEIILNVADTSIKSSKLLEIRQILER